MSNTIKAKQCRIGTTYYLTGMWWDYKFTTNNHVSLINKPVKFIGVNKSIKNGHKDWFDRKGQHVFKSDDDKKYYLYGDDELFILPIKDPEILKK